MIINLIGWCLFGLIVGALARYFVPGPDPMGYIATMGLGIAGSFVVGIVFHVLFNGGSEGVEPAGYIGSVIGAICLLLGVRSYRRSGNDAVRAD